MLTISTGIPRQEAQLISQVGNIRTVQLICGHVLEITTNPPPTNPYDYSQSRMCPECIEDKRNLSTRAHL